MYKAPYSKLFFLIYFVEIYKNIVQRSFCNVFSSLSIRFTNSQSSFIPVIEYSNNVYINILYYHYVLRTLRNKQKINITNCLNVKCARPATKNVQASRKWCEELLLRCSSLLPEYLWTPLRLGNIWNIIPIFFYYNKHSCL